MVQELMAVLNGTTSLVNEITTRMERGDAAEKLVNQLVAQVKIIERYVARLGDGLSNECRLKIAQLLSRVQDAVKNGKNWMAKADGPELAILNLQRRISKTYGLSMRDN